MPFDVDAFMSEVQGLSSEDAQILRGVLSRNSDLQGRLHRKAEADRYFENGRRELEAAKQAADQRVKDAETQLQTLAQWKESKESDLRRAAETVEQARLEAARARAALSKAATEVGFEENTYLGQADVRPEPKKEEPPPFDTKRFVDRETFGTMAVQMLRNQGELLELDQLHRDLFGKPMPNPQSLVDDLLAASQRGEQGATLRSTFERKFNVAERRAELNEQSIQERIKRSVDEALIKERSERALSGNRAAPDGPASPVMAAVAKQGPVGGAREGVMNAVAAYEAMRAKAGATA